MHYLYSIFYVSLDDFEWFGFAFMCFFFQMEVEACSNPKSASVLSVLNSGTSLAILSPLPWNEGLYFLGVRPTLRDPESSPLHELWRPHPRPCTPTVYIYLEPFPKQGLFQSKQGPFGFQVHIILHIISYYRYNNSCGVIKFLILDGSNNANRSNCMLILRDFPYNDPCKWILYFVFSPKILWKMIQFDEVFSSCPTDKAWKLE